ncbi:MAG TPA: hypothetical protein DCL61_20870 [Cyanobacteria bacterium UBA12227]|nr:hypothetical protein [Cyanobacteria bacterium UBA12227]HAX90094.1 hypothetical protein [Cyanobacteria bacterium UBA11370]HBY77267.1 hypothetical protein [Cyanobacteria bacterium UBA11148]
MKLDSRKPDVGVSLHPYYPNAIATPKLEEQTGTWVQLHERPTPYSYDEALLLCQHSDTEWVVWIPDYGEMVLHQNQFC